MFSSVRFGILLDGTVPNKEQGYGKSGVVALNREAAVRESLRCWNLNLQKPVFEFRTVDLAAAANGKD